MSDAEVKAVEKSVENLSVSNDPKENASPAAAEAAEQLASALNATAADTVSLYVGELDPSVTEAILFEIFSQHGTVASIRVCRDTVTRESLGYAYVNFHSKEDAQKAMTELNYAQIKGRTCRIMRSQRDPAFRRSGKGNVFIKNLDPSIDNKGLHDTFAAFGDILSCKVVTDQDGKSLGFGFIHYASPEAAEEAISLVNGMFMNGREVYVAHHLPRSERQPADTSNNKFTNVYVKHLDATVDSDEKLKEVFAKFGEITSAVIARDGEQKPRGFGFVNFASHEAAEKAIEELHDKEIDGQKLYVGRAQNKFERQTELKKQHEAAHLEKVSKYQGVNLYVKNLDESVTDEQLQEAFAPFGSITSAKVMTDGQGHPRGFGFVCYSAPEEANRAISEMHQHLFHGKPLYVALAQRKALRQTQMREQVNARNQLRLQQQAAVAGQMPGQFMGGPGMMYAGQPGFGPRVPFMGQRQAPMAMGMPQNGQPGPWQQAPNQAQPSLASIVANAPEKHKKQIIGEALYPRIEAQKDIKDEELASRITGMLLDMEVDELLPLVEDEAALKEHVAEALNAYNEFLKEQQE